jgi:hypothetical protein
MPAVRDFEDLSAIATVADLVHLAEVSVCGDVSVLRLYGSSHPMRHNVVVGTAWAWGRAHSLGRLATLTHCWDAAEAHFEMAVCRHTQMAALPH